MKNSFDLIVIGAGTAGTGAAMKCRRAGMEVAIIDERPVGGTCALRGCDPKKILVGAAELIDWNTRMQGKGIDTKGNIDWKELIAFKRTFTSGVTVETEKSLAGAGIEIISGHAEFIDEGHVRAGDRVLEGRNFVIATGAIPMPLPFAGKEHMIDSEAFMDLEELPKRIVFAGGGFIAFEFAHIAARAGAEVHIIEMMDRPLVNFDQDMIGMLVRKSKDIGIRIHTGTGVEAVEKTADGTVVHCRKQGEEVLISGDLVVHGAGRVANISGLALEAGGIEFNRKGVVVNDYLQSVSNPAVYAAGDASASPGLPLTPLAVLEGRMAAMNILENNKYKPDYRVMPTTVYTVPKVGLVGLTEEQAMTAGFECRVIKNDMSDWYTYTRTGDAYAMAKVIVDKNTDRILGAHVIGGHADELINQFAMAMHFDIAAKELKRMIYAYPSASSDIAYLL